MPPPDLLLYPLTLVDWYGPPLPLLGAGAGLGLVPCLLRAAWRRQPGPCPLGPAAAGVALAALLPAVRFLPHDRGLAAAFAAPSLALLLTLAVARLARRRGRPPNLAGWLLGPWLALVGLALAQPHRVTYRGAVGPEALWSIHAGHVSTPLVSLAIGLVGVGLALGASSLFPTARRSGHAPRLALLGALAIGIGGLAECTRALAVAWVRGDHPAAVQAWALRHELLLAMLALALAVPLLARWVGPTPGPAHRRGQRLAGAMLALLLALGAWSSARVTAALDLLSDSPVSLAQAPTCPVGTCTGEPQDVAVAGQPRAWMLFHPDLGVIETRLVRLGRDGR